MGVQEIRRAFADAVGQECSVVGARLHYQRPGDKQILEFDCRMPDGDSLTWTHNAGCLDPVEEAQKAAEAFLESKGKVPKPKDKDGVS